MSSMRRDEAAACPDGGAIAIYDLDRTVTRSPTFTSFLLFAARRDAPWRLILMPLWVLALIGYRLGLYGRETLKPFGIALFVGRRMSPERAERLARLFTDRLQHGGGFRPGALAQIEADRESGAILMLATAAPEFYAVEIARRLGFDVCLATLHARTDNGGYRARLSGRNNYGAEKWRRVTAWLTERRLDRATLHITAYSDHASDKPLFDNADRACLVILRDGDRLPGCEIVDWR